MELEKGTQVLIKATIVRRLTDNRPEEERGYTVKTSRGEVMVEPYDIIKPLQEERLDKDLRRV